MRDPFAAALTVLHRAAGSVAASYVPRDGAAPAGPIRVIVGRPDRLARFGDVQVSLGSHTIVLQRSDVPAPRPGDVIQTPDGRYEIVDVPPSDVEGLSFTCWAVEA